MNWNFSFGWVFIGLIILVCGGLILVYHRAIADNLASGVSSYDRVKLFGIITSIIGLLVIANLHTLILNSIFKLIFRF